MRTTVNLIARRATDVGYSHVAENSRRAVVSFGTKVPLDLAGGIATPATELGYLRILTRGAAVSCPRIVLRIDVVLGARILSRGLVVSEPRIVPGGDVVLGYGVFH